MMKFVKNLAALRFRSIRKKLEFGCGAEPSLPGFMGVDIRNSPKLTYVCNAWEITRYVAPQSVTDVYSRHFLEHLTQAQADLTLQSWFRVLTSNGTLQIVVPDMRYHIAQFLDEDPSARSEANENWTARQHAIAGFWGWQREGLTETWDLHKSGYDFRLLRMKLAEHGYVDIVRLEDRPWNLNVTCKKPQVPASQQNGS